MEHSPQLNNIQDVIQSENFEILGRGSKPNTLKVIDNNTAQEGELNLDVYKKALKGKEFNSPDTPLRSSGIVGFDDRLKLAMGNAQGKLSFLKSQTGIENASFNKEGELVIQKNGIWEKIDKEGLGSGNYKDMARELVGDFADVAGYGLVMAPSIMGSSLGPAGAALGAMAGEGVRTALGQLVGSYEDVSLTEDGSTKVSLNAIKDMATEGALVLAGDKITKVGLKYLSKAGSVAYNKILQPSIQKIGEVLQGANTEVKDAMAGLLKFATNATDGAASRLSRNPKGVMEQVQNVVAKVKTGADYENIISQVKEANASKLFTLAKQAPKHINAKYGNQLNSVINQLDDQNFSLEMSGSFQDVLLKGGQIAGEAFEGLANHPFLGRLMSQDKSGRLVVKKINEISGLGIEESAIVAKSLPKVKQLLNIIQSSNKSSNQLIGKSGFETTKQIQGLLDDLTYDVLGNNKPLQDMVKPLIMPFRNGLKKGIKSEQLQQSFGEAQDFYSKNIALKYKAQKLSQQFNKDKLGSALDDLMTPEAQKTLGFSKQLMNLADDMGPMSKKLANEILDSEASLQFSRLSPHIRNLASGPGLLLGAGGGLGAMSGDGEGAALGLGVAATLLSPRMAGKAAARVLSTADDVVTGNGLLGMERVLRQTFSSGNQQQIQKFLPIMMGKFNAERAKGTSDKVIMEMERMMQNEGTRK